MIGFLFQATAANYERARPEPGKTVWWRAQRYRSLMHPGSLVFFWVAGEDTIRGLHGWGRLASEPYKKDADFLVDVRFERHIEPHIGASAIRGDKVLADHPIFTVRVGSNFLLDDAELRALIVLIPLPQRPELVSA